MSSDTLVYGRGTQGSFTILIHGNQLRNRAGVAPRFYMIAVNRPYAPDQPEPVQSAGESSGSLQIEDYLGTAMASFDDLASNSPRQIRMTASPEARAANMDPWKVKNRRRIRLIKKKNSEGLSSAETAELKKLKTEFAAHVREISPRSSQSLEEFEAYVKKMREQVEAKKG